jgi:phospholipase/lecithinase/hemolysin
MKIRWSICVLAVTLALAMQAVAARSYDAIYVFGDSYCDVGNIFLATKGATPLSPPYYHGRFSNGPIWVEHLAGALRLPMQPSLAGGTDYAVGGAEVTQAVVTSQGTIPSVPQQVEEYLAAHGGHADPHALYIIEGGGNDILHASTEPPAQLGFEIALGITGSELLLRRAGARNFLIPNLIDVGQLPAAHVNAAYATAATIATNTRLNQFLRFERWIDDLEIERMDVFALLHQIATDPTHFGFANITTPCLNPATNAVCRDPDHTLFWDVEHPTEFVHSFFAVLAASELKH